jgi:hypothetical protein
MDTLRHYRQIIVGDFEYSAAAGGLPEPRCGVFHELRSGKTLRLWLDGAPANDPPFGTGEDALFVGFYTPAEMSCFLRLGWNPPANVLDLYAEFRREKSGLPGGKNGLLHAMRHFNLPTMAVEEKSEMRALALRGGPYTPAEQRALLDYCGEDVRGTVLLLRAMLPVIDLPRALLRGRYTIAVARIEAAGIPIDADLWARLRAHWEAIKAHLIGAVNEGIGVYVRAGLRKIDPNTKFGSALLATAADYDVDPHHLLSVVTYLWEEERAATAEFSQAVAAARKMTGLTIARINRWEDAGHDSAGWPGLDVIARSLAGQLPALGIGQGYTAEGGYDDVDYEGQLWALLRQPTPKAPPKWDSRLLWRAAEIVAATPADGMRPSGPMIFAEQRFAEYLIRADIPWPHLTSGRLALDDETFRLMAKAFPEQIGPIRELRYVLSQLKLRELVIGPDGRNRVMLSPFGSKTGRNQPSNSKYIFGPAVFLRSLIQPPPGKGLAYLDWSQQELAIAAYLSGDAKMQDAYRTGDFYLTFAKMAGAVPQDATKDSHEETRNQFKALSLGVLYGLTAVGLALRLDAPLTRGQELLELHRQVFPVYWEWSDRVETEAMMFGELETPFGWKVHVPGGFDPNTRRPLANPRSLRNFPMQGTGSDMMRIACILATERGHKVCAVVHDALLIEADADEIDAEAEEVQRIMEEASEITLPRFPLRTEAKIVRHPDRYADKRGRKMWEIVLRVLECVESREPNPAVRNLVLSAREAEGP